MGVRFRKSKKIGPVRFTLSKSGLSTSIGVKGFRVTKTASGRLRTTASIPGTGISYVTDMGGKTVEPARASQQYDAQRVQQTSLLPGYKSNNWWMAFTPGVLLLLNAAAMKDASYTIVLIAGGLGAILTILGVILMLKDSSNRKAAMRERQNMIAAAAQEARIREAQEAARRRQEYEAKQQAIAAERAKIEAQQAEWERTHGRIVTAIAGVTFKNDDGTSRQAILKDLKARGDNAELHLEEFEYKGHPAVRVMVDDDCIGNIPKNRVDDVLSVMDRLESSRLDIETFRPEDEEDEDGNVRRRGNLIYRADLYLVYKK